MAELADGFVALPGGLGTLEELLEVLPGPSSGIHAKPLGLLNVAGYWTPLVALRPRGRRGLRHAASTARCSLVADTPAALLDGLAAGRRPRAEVRSTAPRLSARTA